MTHLMCYKSQDQSNLNCWKTRNALVKFPLRWNRTFMAYLEEEEEKKREKQENEYKEVEEEAEEEEKEEQ